jgi:hypothetical protein
MRSFVGQETSCPAMYALIRRTSYSSAHVQWITASHQAEQTWTRLSTGEAIFLSAGKVQANVIWGCLYFSGMNSAAWGWASQFLGLRQVRITGLGEFPTCPKCDRLLYVRDSLNSHWKSGVLGLRQLAPRRCVNTPSMKKVGARVRPNLSTRKELLQLTPAPNHLGNLAHPPSWRGEGGREFAELQQCPNPVENDATLSKLRL